MKTKTISKIALLANLLLMTLKPLAATLTPLCSDSLRINKTHLTCQDSLRATAKLAATYKVQRNSLEKMYLANVELYSQTKDTLNTLRTEIPTIETKAHKKGKKQGRKQGMIATVVIVAIVTIIKNALLP